MKTLLKSIFACVVVMMAGRVSAQTFPHINPPPCDFSDQFYGDNGLVATSSGEVTSLLAVGVVSIVMRTPARCPARWATP